MSNRVGQQLGAYRLIRLVGRGGFAEVYLGEHIYLKSYAALKALHTVLKDKDAEDFVREAQTLARLIHPHIVRVLDFAVEDGTPFLVMDFAPNDTLRHRHPKGTRLPLDLIVSYVQQVTSALQYAHDQRIIHRDVKPENMLLSARDEVLLSDFGLAQLSPHTLSARTQPMGQSMTGTTPYLAPEQLQGQARPASDQYSLGVVVYEWICGTRPFHGSSIEIAMQHLSVSPPPLREHFPDLSPTVEEVVLRALAKEQQQRFSSVQEFAIALERASRGGLSRLSPPSLTSALPASHPHLSTITSEEFTQEQPSSELLASSTLASASLTVSELRQNTPDDTATLEPIWKVPTTFTPLIGREQDVAAVCALLMRPEVRTLTLVGTGGIGKTRLSLQVATEMREYFVDGICFVPLAAISDPNLVISTIAYELGIQETGEQRISEQVKAYLRDKHLLLLLDNFEQIVAAAPVVEELLSACPHLKVLVTSRAVLHVQGEHEFPVSPLALPDLNQLPGSDGLSQYAAIALFVQRARALLPTFQITQTNARALAEICVHLDGLPLAIELAAARIKLLPPQALLTRLTQRLQVLTSGARTLPARQQTLRNTLKWSYDLLDAQEQRLFRWLSVFVGGCTLEAVEAVCQAKDDQTTDILNTIESLIDKSFVQQTEQEGDEPRLLILETVREYGQECLIESGEAKDSQRAHAAYFLALAEKTKPYLRGAEQAVWLERLARDQENLRAALQWVIEHEDAEYALRFSAALEWFWYVRGYWSEERRWLEQALSRSGEVVTLGRAKALNVAGNLANMQGEYNQAEMWCTESLRLFRLLGDRRGAASSLVHLAFGASEQGQYAKATSLAEEALALARESGAPWSTGYALAILIRMHLFQGDHVTAKSLAEESRVLFLKLGDNLGIATSLGYLGMAAVMVGDYDTARPLLEEAWALSKKIRNKKAITESLWTLARAVFGQKDYATARTLYLTLYQECLTTTRDVNTNLIIALALRGLGEVAAVQGQLAEAARLWGVAEGIRAPLWPFEYATYPSLVTTVRDQLGEEAFAAAWAEGRMMTPEQAFATLERVAKTETEHDSVAPSSPVSAQPSPPPALPDDLTAREIEVLRLVAQGWTDAQIARHLVISPRTVNTHLTSIYRKILVTSRSAATRYAIEHHLI